MDDKWNFKWQFVRRKNGNKIGLLAGGLSAILMSPSGFCQQNVVSTPQLQITTESSYPLAFFANDGKTPVGEAVDKLQEMMRRAKIFFQIEIMNWNRAFELARTQSNTCALSTAKTAERVKLFKWVGPIAKGDWEIFGIASQLNKVTRIEQIKSAKIGSNLGDVITEYLIQHGYQVLTSYNEDATIKNLMVGRLDYWASDYNQAIEIINKNGLRDKIKPLFNFGATDYYLACNLDTDDAIISRLRDSLRQIKDDGTEAKIEARYQNSN